MLARSLGLMTTDLPARTASPTLGQTWQLLATAGSERAVPVLFFHPHAIHQADRTVQGFQFTAKSGWRYGRHPLPQVVVDNVFVTVARQDRRYAEHKRWLQATGVTVLNPRLPDKWGVWQALLKRPELRPHLPQTALLRSVDEIEAWLGSQSSVFVKPVRGSGGFGVLQIAHDGAAFRLTDSKRQATLSRQLFRRQLGKRLQQQRHLIQAGLPLFEVDGRKIDLRVVLHRGGDRRWHAVATVPRVGRQGQFITNLAQGGEVQSLDWLQHHAQRQGLTLPTATQIEQVAIHSAEAVTRIRPTLAFLGLDIAVDERGGLWTLDLNPRPGRKVLSTEHRRRAFGHLVDFATLLLQ